MKMVKTNVENEKRQKILTFTSGAIGTEFAT